MTETSGQDDYILIDTDKQSHKMGMYKCAICKEWTLLSQYSEHICWALLNQVIDGECRDVPPQLGDGKEIPG